MAARMGIDIIRAMSMTGFLIGVMVVGLAIYTAALSRVRDFGILKAIGANLRKLYVIVLQQAIISTLVGFVAGVALSFASRILIQNLFPEMLILVKWSLLSNVFLATFGISIVASLTPVRRIAKIDPMLVFKA
jgi:putative ABC transport system permease protein